jgi:glycosyltransferase 2 family protein
MTPPLTVIWLRKQAPVALRFGVSLLLLVLLLRKAGSGTVFSALAKADPRWISAALTLGLLSTLIQATQWQALLSAMGVSRQWGRCLRLVFVGNAFNTVLPSSVGGDVVRALLVTEQSTERAAAAASVVLQRLCNFPGMIMLAGAGLLFTAGRAEANAARPVALAGIVIATLGLGLVVTPLLGWLTRTGWASAIPMGRPVARVFAALDSFRGQGRQLLLASGRGVLFWSLSVINQWCFMHALRIPVDLGYAAVVVTTINALTMLPISINGYGLREGAFVAFLSTNRLATTGQAVAVGLSLEAQSLLWAAIGLACWLTLPRLGRRVAAPQLLEVSA